MKLKTSPVTVGKISFFFIFIYSIFQDDETRFVFPKNPAKKYTRKVNTKLTMRHCKIGRYMHPARERLEQRIMLSQHGDLLRASSGFP